MPGLIRAYGRQAAMVLAATLSALALAPVLADAHALSFASRARVAAVPKTAYMLGGITSQGEPVVVAVSGRAKSVDARIALEMKCTSGTPLFSDRTFPLAVKRNGAVLGYNLVIPPDPKGNVLGGSDTFSAQMNAARSRLTGHWRLRLTFQNSDGSREACDSGPVSFTAS
jgi:hypothetical protein